MISNNMFQKNANTALVARTIWKSPGIARADIARELNLYRSTVTNIINYLIEHKIVIEGEERTGQSHSGRKPITLSLNDKIGYVAGFNIQPSHYRIVLLDIYGHEQWQEIGETPNKDFESILDFLMHKVIAASDYRGIPLLGCCFGIPGVIDSEKGYIHYSEPLKIKEFDCYTYLSHKYSVPLIIENDANCTAWYEMNKNLDIKNFITLYGDFHDSENPFDDRNGIGIGLGIAIDREVYHGAHSSAGEFCSATWHDNPNGQTGIADKELKKMRSDEVVFKQWIKDIFTSFVPLLSVFDPEVLYILGTPFKDKDYILETVKTEAPGFLKVLDRYNIRLEFEPEEELFVAKGAAMMYLQNMFSIPEISKMDSRMYFDWEKFIKEFNN